MIKKLENIWRSRFLLRNLRCVKSAMNVCIMNDNKIWQDWTILLGAIARERLVSSPLSQQFISTHHLPATSSVRTALKALVDKQLVSKTPTGYLVSDRFFAKWLVRGGIIANWGNENYVPMQHLLRPDAVTDTSRRNSGDILLTSSKPHLSFK